MKTLIRDREMALYVDVLESISKLETNTNGSIERGFFWFWSKKIIALVVLENHATSVLFRGNV